MVRIFHSTRFSKDLEEILNDNSEEMGTFSASFDSSNNENTRNRFHYSTVIAKRRSQVAGNLKLSGEDTLEELLARVQVFLKKSENLHHIIV